MRQITMWEKLDEFEKKDEIEEMVEKNSNLIWHAIGIMEKKGWLINYQKTFDQEDIYQIGSIGLFRAATLFDATKGYKFSTYATRSIINTILNELKKNTVGTSGESYDSLTGSLDYIESFPEESTGDDQINIEKINLAGIVEKAIKKDPANEAELRFSYKLLKEYGEGYSWKEVAYRNGMTAGEVKKKIGKLKKAIKPN